jgi:hypothetical protein
MVLLESGCRELRDRNSPGYVVPRNGFCPSVRTSEAGLWAALVALGCVRGWWAGAGILPDEAQQWQRDSLKGVEFKLDNPDAGHDIPTINLDG